MDVCSIHQQHRTAASQRDIVSRAETFVKAHLADSVGIGQLCRVTGVSERTLRNAFYGARGSSPKQVVLRLRLENVRAALAASAPNATVTTVATTCGFYDLGRFAGQYKAVFGEYPSDTLRTRTSVEKPASGFGSGMLRSVSDDDGRTGRRAGTRPRVPAHLPATPPAPPVYVQHAAVLAG